MLTELICPLPRKTGPVAQVRERGVRANPSASLRAGSGICSDIRAFRGLSVLNVVMPTGLRRFQQSGQSHFPTFSYYRRQAKLFGRREGKSRFLDSAGSSAFAEDPAALEMTMGNWKPQWYVRRKGQRTRADNAVWLASASNIPTLNFANNAKFRMGHPAIHTAAYSGRSDTTTGTSGMSESSRKNCAIYTGIR
jgi:hypothetical protein